MLNIEQNVFAYKLIYTWFQDPSIETERCSSHVIVEDFTEEEESLKRPFSEGNYASLRIPFVSPTASAASLPNVKTCSGTVLNISPIFSCSLVLPCKCSVYYTK